MNKEMVSVTVHRTGSDNLKQTIQAPSISENPSDMEQQLHKKNGRPSRHWLVSELEKTVEKNSELTKQLEFQKDLSRSLLETKSRLEREVASLRSRRVVGAHENEAIRERNKQLSQDIFLMKNILVKLNIELERYQDKLRKYEKSQVKIDLNSSTNHKDKKQSHSKEEWINGEMTILAPLLIAYEESLREKEELITDFRVDMETLSWKMKEIAKENSELRREKSESETQGEVNYSDWMNLRRELEISVEQNQLLVRQTKLAQSKLSDLKAAFQKKLNEVCNERDEAVSKLSLLRTDYFVLKGRNSALEEEYERLKEDNAERIPKATHSTYIAECKRLLNELKSRHAEERNSLLKKIEDLKGDTPASQCILTLNNNEKLKHLEMSLEESEERRLKCERKRKVMKERLDALVQFSKELILEHESLLKSVNGELRLNANLSTRIDKIKQQLKGVEMETLEQIKILDENINSQVEKVNRVRNEKNIEVFKLKEELQTKEMQIKELKNAAKNREKDLKLVWEAAISEKKTSTEQ